MISDARVVKDLSQLDNTCVDAYDDRHVIVINVRLGLHHVVAHGLLKKSSSSRRSFFWATHEFVGELCSISVNEDNNERAVILLASGRQLRFAIANWQGHATDNFTLKSSDNLRLFLISLLQIGH